MKPERPFRLAFPLLLIASLACAPDAHAGEFCIGADLNRAFVDENIDVDGTDVPLDGETTGGRLLLGYAFNDFFAAEISHVDFGELDQSALGLSLSAEAGGQELAVLGLGIRFRF